MNNSTFSIRRIFFRSKLVVIILLLAGSTFCNCAIAQNSNVTIDGTTVNSSNGVWTFAAALYKFTPNANGAHLSVAEVIACLKGTSAVLSGGGGFNPATNGAGSVQILTTNATGTENGDITLVAGSPINGPNSGTAKTLTFTAGRNITINDAINLSGAVGTSAATGTAGAAGDNISLMANNGLINIASTVTTNGGSGGTGTGGVGGAGGAGGVISLSASGPVTVNTGSAFSTIGGTGGNGTAGGSTGGTGGAITVGNATPIGGTISINSSLTSSGGNGGNATSSGHVGGGGGVAGNVSIVASGSIGLVVGSTSTPAITANGGSSGISKGVMGGPGANGGTITVTSGTGTVVTIGGEIASNGGNGSTVTSSGGPGSAGGAGNVIAIKGPGGISIGNSDSLTAYGGIGGVGDGGIGGAGGNGSYISLISSGVSSAGVTIGTSSGINVSGGSGATSNQGGGNGGKGGSIDIGYPVAISGSININSSLTSSGGTGGNAPSSGYAGGAGGAAGNDSLAASGSIGLVVGSTAISAIIANGGNSGISQGVTGSNGANGGTIMVTSGTGTLVTIGGKIASNGGNGSNNGSSGAAGSAGGAGNIITISGPGGISIGNSDSLTDYGGAGGVGNGGIGGAGGNGSYISLISSGVSSVGVTIGTSSGINVSGGNGGTSNQAGGGGGKGGSIDIGYPVAISGSININSSLTSSGGTGGNAPSSGYAGGAGGAAGNDSLVASGSIGLVVGSTAIPAITANGGSSGISQGKIGSIGATGGTIAVTSGTGTLVTIGGKIASNGGNGSNNGSSGAAGSAGGAGNIITITGPGGISIGNLDSLTAYGGAGGIGNGGIGGNGGNGSYISLISSGVSSAGVTIGTSSGINVSGGNGGTSNQAGGNGGVGGSIDIGYPVAISGSININSSLTSSGGTGADAGSSSHPGGVGGAAGNDSLVASGSIGLLVGSTAIPAITANGGSSGSSRGASGSIGANGGTIIVTSGTGTLVTIGGKIASNGGNGSNVGASTGAGTAGGKGNIIAITGPGGISIGNSDSLTAYGGTGGKGAGSTGGAGGNGNTITLTSSTGVVSVGIFSGFSTVGGNAIAGGTTTGAGGNGATISITGGGGITMSSGLATTGGTGGSTGVSASITLSDGACTVTAGGGTGTNDGISGVISGGSLISSGTGAIQLSGTNTYSGTTTISNGTLQIGSANALTSGTSVTLTSGKLSTVVGVSSPAITTIATLGTLSFNGSSGIIFGSGTHNLKFASGTAWGANILSVYNWLGSSTGGQLVFISNTGVVPADISFVGYSGGASSLLGAGPYQVVNSGTYTGPPVPSFILPVTSLVCTGQSGVVYTTQSPESNYVWTISGGTITAGGTSLDNTATVTWGAAGTGTISVNYGATCPLTNLAASQTVTINAKSANPTSATAASPTICLGSSTTLTLNGGGGGTGEVVTWYTGTCGGTLIGTGNGFLVNPSITTTYYGRYEDGAPCSYNSICQPVIVTVNQKSADPTSATVSSSLICNGSSTTLTLNGGGGGTGETIHWYSGTCTGTPVGTGNNLSVSPSATTTYYGRYEDGAPCNYNSICQPVIVTVNQKSADPTSATAASPTICNGSSTTLTLSGGGGGTGEVVTWYTGTCGGSLIGTGNGFSVNPSITTTYYGRYEDGAPCSYNSICQPVIVTVNQKSADPTSATVSSSLICNGSSTTLTLNGGGGGTGETIHWYSGTCTGTPVGTGNNLSVSPSATTTYYGRYEDGAPCNYNSICQPVIVTVNQKSADPTSATAASPTICNGSSTTLTLSGGGGGTGEVVTWYTGTCGGTLIGTGNGFLVNPSITTTYYGRYEDGAPCNYNSICQPVIVTVTDNTWTGFTSTNWNDATNWCGGIPNQTENVLIPVVASNLYPNLNTGTGATKDITINPAASVTVSSTGILSIAGNISNSGTFDATTGTIQLDGASTQTLDGSMFVNRTIYNLTDSNISAQLLNTGSDTLNITGTFSFGNINNATFTTNNNLTLKSTSSNTAGVADITNAALNTGNTISGNVTVERYFPAHRSWRLVTAPISSTGAPTINASWQEGFSNVSRLAPKFSAGADIIYGTIITHRTSEISNGSGGTTDGFDQGSTNNPSILALDTITKKWKLPTLSTDSGSVTEYPGFMLFVRGNRDYFVAGPEVPPTTTTLRVNGSLKMGTQTITGKGFTVIGNPYPSTIYYDGFITRGKSIAQGGTGPGYNTPDYYYVWDPLMTGTNEVGAFVTLHQLSSHTYTAVPDPSIVNPLNGNIHPFDTTGVIQSGQAFLTFFTDGTPSLPAVAGTSTIVETDKVATNDNYVFRPAAPLAPLIDTTQQFRTNLYAINSDGTTSLEDGDLDLYNNSYSDTVNYLEDAPKLGNIDETIALLRQGHYLSIEARKIIGITDTVYYSMFGMQQKQYVLEFIATGLNHPALSGFLIDSFLHTRTPISLSGITDIPFTVSSNAASSATNRFNVVFVPLAAGSLPLPVTFTSVKAWQQNDNQNSSNSDNNSIAVQWSVENQLNIKEYEVEKSTDGKTFTKVNTTAAINNNAASITYNWIDENAVEGDNYYRIESIGNDGAISYSQVVLVNIGSGNPSITVYPNPVQDGVIGLQFTNMPAGKYSIRLLDNIGQVMAGQEINHTNGSSLESMGFNKTMAKGVYHLEVTGPDNYTGDIKVIY